MAIPHDFFKRVVREACGVRLPEVGQYAVMMAFLPKEPELYHAAKGVVAKCASVTLSTLLSVVECKDTCRHEKELCGLNT